MALLLDPRPPDPAEQETSRSVQGRGAALATHVPALDGLRAVAVVAVVAFHFGVGFVRGGLLGVDIFFVLSGFLITSLLLDEHVRRGTVRLREFWGRRARRLLPALLLLVVAVVVSSRWLTDQTDAGSLRDDAIATLAYVANWHFAASGQDYFGALAADSPLLHTWSLGIEEQFYVVWPLVVVLLLRLRRGERWLRYVAVAGAAASTAWLTHLALQGVGTSRLYYGTDTRIAALLVGAALATLRPARLAGGDAGLRNEGRRDELLRRGVAGLGVAGAIALTVAVFVMRGEDPVLYHGGFLVVALAAAAVIAAAVGTPGSALSRALSVAPLRLVGRVSYGIYLWHWPVQLVVTRSRTELGGWALVTARVLITMVLATASYLLVERPVRRLSWATPRRRAVAVAAIAATLATVLLGTTLAAPVEQRAAAAPSESSIGTSGLVPAAAASADVPEPTIPTRSLSASDAPRTPLGRTTRILLVGDSIAATLGWNLGSVQAQTSTDVYLDAPLGCGIVLGQHNDRGNVISDPSECAQWPQRWTREVNSYDPDVVAVLIGRWEMTDRYYQGAWRHLGDPVFDDYVRQQLERAVEIGSSTGAQVALLNPPCLDDPERPDGGAWPQNDPARARRLTELQREVTDAHPGKVQLLDLASLICPGGQYARSIGGVQVRERDGVHFTRSGARFVGRSLLPALRAIAEEDRYRKRHPQSTTSAASANSAGSTTSAASANSRSTG